MVNPVDEYGKRHATQAAALSQRPPVKQERPVITSTADIQQVCKMAADAVNASAKKIANDILGAADAVQAIAEFIIKDAEQFAQYVEDHSGELSNHVNHFAQAGNTVAQSFRDSKEKVLSLQQALMPARTTNPDTPKEPSNPQPSSEGESANLMKETQRSRVGQNAP